MSLLRRKPRPLNRDSESLRDDRLFIVACDDTYAPKQYFGFFKLTRVQVHVVPTTDGSAAAAHVLERLLEFESEEDDQRWLLLDTDHYIRGNHVASFTSAITRANQLGVNVALSRPSFDLWLLLHHVSESEVSALTNANAVARKLREILGEYNKTNLKQEHYPLDSVVSAVKRAETLDASVQGGHVPHANTTRVYRLWKAIVGNSLKAQLPVELRALLE